MPCLESNISKTCGLKNLKFFEGTTKFPYFDVWKNGGRGSNRLGVKKIVRDPSRAASEVNTKSLQRKLQRFKKSE